MVRTILGIVLIVVAFIELFLFIGGPENKLVADAMTALTCQSGERFIQVLGGYVYDSDGGQGQSFNFYCQDAAGNQRDVTMTGIIVGIVGYIVPFLIGLILVIVGPIGMKRGRMNAATVGSIGFTAGVASPRPTDPFGNPVQISDLQTPAQVTRSTTVVTMNGQQTDLSSLPPETAQLVQQVLGGLGSMVEAGKFVSEGGDLTGKLEQLKAARDKNLITQEEYDRLRKAILDHMG